MSGAAPTRTEVVPFSALDGTQLTLLHVRRTADRSGAGAQPWRGPVLLVHGAGVRAEIFRPPTSRTIVDALLDEGWDPWLLNWRGSIDLDPVPWTVDDAALLDHPAAVREVVRRTGADSVKAIIHCQGSTSFAVSAAAGLVPEVDTIVSNAVSLHPVLPPWSKVKILRMAPMIRRFIPYVSPAWGDRPRGNVSRAVAWGVRAVHRECDNGVCRMVSFTYGAGFPALWSHDNLDEATHDWLRGEFGIVPFTFFEQMARSVVAGHMVPAEPAAGLGAGPGAGRAAGADAWADAWADAGLDTEAAAVEQAGPGWQPEPPRTDARWVLLAGEDNLCFLPDSQVRTYDYLRATRPGGGDTLHLIPRYGHLDVFLGARAAEDTFPIILEELAAS